MGRLSGLFHGGLRRHKDGKQIFYRVSVRGAYGFYYVRHAGLTKKRADELVLEYAIEGVKAQAIRCDGLREKYR